MKKNVVIMFMAVGILLSGCESAKPKPKIKSIADASFSRKVNKVFIIISLPQIGWEESAAVQHESFRKAIVARFNSLDLETESENVSGQDAQAYALKEKMAAFNADVVFAVHAVSYNTKNKLLHEIVFDVSIFDEVSKKRIWKANWIMDTADPDSGTVKADGKTVADGLYATVMDQLEADGMAIFGRF